MWSSWWLNFHFTPHSAFLLWNDCLSNWLTSSVNLSTAPMKFVPVSGEVHRVRFIVIHLLCSCISINQLILKEVSENFLSVLLLELLPSLRTKLSNLCDLIFSLLEFEQTSRYRSFFIFIFHFSFDWSLAILLCLLSLTSTPQICLLIVFLCHCIISLVSPRHL